MQFANSHHDVVVDLQAMLGKRLKKTSGSSEGNFSTVAIEEARPGFVFKRANLRRDGGLGHAQLFGCAGKAFQPAYFQESSELFEIHAKGNPVYWLMLDCE
jgi:hypothetical protein